MPTLKTQLPLFSSASLNPTYEIKRRMRQAAAETGLSRDQIADRMNEILAKHTGQPLKKIQRDTDRNFFMSPEEAQEYGIIDEVIEKKQ